jgi:hypothetical protein
VDVGLVVLGEVLLGGVAGLFGVVAVPLGVVVVPVEEVEPGVIVLLPLVLPVVPVVELPVFEDCGTPELLAGTQFAELVVLLVVVLPDEDGIVLEELGEVLLVELLALGVVLEVELGDVLLVELGEVLLVELGDVLLVEELGVVVLEAEAPGPVALALVEGTMPGGQLFTVLLGDVLLGDVLGVVDVPVCEEGEVEVPVWDDGDVDVSCEGEVLVVELELVVVDVVCAATHVAHTVRINTSVNFFMVFVLIDRINRVAIHCDAHPESRVSR